MNCEERVRSRGRRWSGTRKVRGLNGGGEGVWNIVRRPWLPRALLIYASAQLLTTVQSRTGKQQLCLGPSALLPDFHIDFPATTRREFSIVFKKTAPVACTCTRGNIIPAMAHLERAKSGKNKSWILINTVRTSGPYSSLFIHDVFAAANHLK